VRNVGFMLSRGGSLEHQSKYCATLPSLLASSRRYDSREGLGLHGSTGFTELAPKIVSYRYCKSCQNVVCILFRSISRAQMPRCRRSLTMMEKISETIMLSITNEKKT
jgi:hypothetical protein